MARKEQRLDRKALKQDELLNLVEQAGDYVKANSNVVLGVLAGVVVVVLLGVLWSRDARQKATQADQGLSQAVLAYTGGAFEQAIEAANALQTNNAGSKAATLSKYLVGASQLRLGRFAEAEQSLRGYLESASKAPFYENAAHEALAASLEAQGRFADAAVQYQEVAAKLAEPLASEAQLDAARALRAAGSVDQAKGILEKLAAPTSPVSRQAKIELAVLEGGSRAPQR